MSTRNWMLAIAAVTLGLLGFVACLPRIIQPLYRLLLFPHYRFRIRGVHHIPRTGPILLVANHVSWLDGFVLAACCPRRGRILVNADFVRLPILRFLARRAGLIEVPFSGPHTAREAIRTARKALDKGEAVGLFPEAQISRNGLLGPFYRGLEVIVKDRDDVPVVPVYLDNLWGSVFSFSGGRFFNFPPKGWRRTVNVVFGAPVPPPITIFAVRQALLIAGVHAVELRASRPPDLETIDPSLPHLDHPALGRLTGSAPDIHRGNIHQIGQKPGSVGLPLPGVALKVVDEHELELPPDTEGRLQVLVAGRPGWIDVGLRATLDRDGFIYLRATMPTGPE
jgi:1-acyl-sn-glycerol-3-phosphate acyltransferase